MGEEIDLEKSQSSDSFSIKSSSFFQGAKQHGSQQESSEPSNSSAGVNQTFQSRTDYDKLCLSLLCGLPNEQELALNVCTILSNEGNYMLHLEQTPKLVELLVAQTGIFPQGDDALKMLFLESWKDLKGRNVHRFWRCTLDLEKPELLELLQLDLGDYDPHCKLLNLESDFGAHNVEGQRILRIALILHNLSFEKNNVPVLVSSRTFIRFMLLCIHSSWGNLKQVAYDTLSNLASAIKISVEKDVCSRLIFRNVVDGILSYDRYMNIRSMDILSQLCSHGENEDVIPSLLDVEVYQQMVGFLTVRDIMLLFYTLEALYALSDLGRYACDKIVTVHRCIGALVSLLTLEPTEYGPSGQINMKIVKTLVPVDIDGESASNNTGTVVEEASLTEVGVTSTTTTTTTTTTATTIIEPVDAEGFAMNWLKSTYEISPGNSVSRNEIYSDYLTVCTKAGRKDIVNANVFAEYVKKTFPTCGVKKFESKGIITFHHDGLQKKGFGSKILTPVSKPLSNMPISRVSTPSTPVSCKPPQKTTFNSILKSQLSAAPKIVCTTAQKITTQASPIQKNNPPLSTTLSQRTIAPSTPSSAGSSTLIKSLLASKVQQRNLQQQVVPSNVSKMVIYSPGASGILGPHTTVVRCIRPGIHAVNIGSQIRSPLQTCLVSNNGSTRIITNASPRFVKNTAVIRHTLQPQVIKQNVTSTTSQRVNGLQKDMQVVEEESLKTATVTSTPQMTQVIHGNSQQSNILQNTVQVSPQQGSSQSSVQVNSQQSNVLSSSVGQINTQGSVLQSSVLQVNPQGNVLPSSTHQINNQQGNILQNSTIQANAQQSKILQNSVIQVNTQLSNILQNSNIQVNPQHNTLQNSVIPMNTAQSNILQSSAVQGTTQNSVIQTSAVQGNTQHSNIIQSSAIQGSAQQGRIIQSSAVQVNTQHNNNPQSSVVQMNSQLCSILQGSLSSQHSTLPNGDNMQLVKNVISSSDLNLNSLPATQTSELQKLMGIKDSTRCDTPVLINQSIKIEKTEDYSFEEPSHSVKSNEIKKEILPNVSVDQSLVQSQKILSSPTSILKSVLSDFELPTDEIRKQQQQKDILKRAPLLNGLLDKGKLPLHSSVQSNTLILNGNENATMEIVNPKENKSPQFVQLNQNSFVIPVSSLNSVLSGSPSNLILMPVSNPVISSSQLSSGIPVISSSQLNSGIPVISSSQLSSGIPVISSSQLSSGIPVISSSQLNSGIPVISSSQLNSGISVIPSSSLNSGIIATSSVNSSGTFISPSTSTVQLSVPNPVIPSNATFLSNGSNLMQLCIGQTTLSGTVEVQSDQQGVVRLHIESPENSNQGSDLSSISDITRTLECASKALLKTNAECNSQVSFSGVCETAASTVVTTTVTTTSPSALTRTGQQFFVVTPTINQPQLQIQQPNFKFHILHSIPKIDEPIDLINFSNININQSNQHQQVSSETSVLSTPSLKRPSSDISTQPNVPIAKKPCLDNKSLSESLQTPTSVPCTLDSSSESTISLQDTKSHLLKTSQTENSEIVSKLTTPKTTVKQIKVESVNDKGNKTFSGLTSNNIQIQEMRSAQGPQKSKVELEFICEWKNCGMKFQNPSSVFLHVSKAHAPIHSNDLVCLWEGCESIKRRRLSHLTHLQDWHCNESVLQNQAVRRKQIAQTGKSSLPPPQKPPPHPGYAPDAALLAIKRHALQYINPKELSEEKESVLTKSIRLTSALILRNLVTHSNLARTYLRRFEPDIAYLAMSPVESARTLAQCLSQLYKTHD